MYVIYMEMHHNTVDGMFLLARIRVGQDQSYEQARAKRRDAEHDYATSRNMLSQIGFRVMDLNPQAGSIKTDFIIACE